MAIDYIAEQRRLNKEALIQIEKEKAMERAKAREAAIAADKARDYEKFGSYGDAARKNMESGNVNPMGDTYKKGGKVKSSASTRADGCAQRGKTRGKMV